jgi:diguanylate cyclase (GGDEF)-like protein
MRRFSLTGLLVAVACLGLGFASAVVEQDRARSQLERELRAASDEHAGQLEAYAARARAIVLLTANTPAFERFVDRPGTRLHKIRTMPAVVRDATHSLSQLELLYPSSIGEACFIDRNGEEITRVVHGRVATLDELSLTEEFNPFFRPTFALRPGQVHQQHPYVSPDTHEWVVANATPVPTKDGSNRAIVHFEITIESFRRAFAHHSGDYQVRVLDARTGSVVIDGGRPQRAGAPLGVPGDRRFAALVRGGEGRGEVDGHLSVYRRVRRTSGDANDWVVVATAAKPLGTLGDVGPTPIALVLFGGLLLVFALLNLRAGRRELEAAAATDVLTGLPNRRRLIVDLERLLARGAEEPAIVALFDLNGFKHYNDTFGHLAGDALLTRLGQALRRAVAAPGKAYRLGGDEFCVLARAGVCEHIEVAAAAALSEHGEGFAISASFGVVLVPGEAATATDALRIADQRMYAHKSGGRATAGRQSRDVLLRALSERHPDLEIHVGGVAELAAAVARGLGLDDEALNQIRHAAELHDVGKVAIPDAILHKPGPLDEAEWAFMRRHTLIGERILAAAPSLAPVAKLVRSSHERWDGGGYPDGLAGDAIPLGARIIAVCDAFDAIVSERPYRAARSQAEALDELRRYAGAQFDPAVVDAFAHALADRERLVAY